MDPELARQIGEMTAEQRGTNRRLDEMMGVLRGHIEDDKELAERIGGLEKSRAELHVQLRTIKWFGGVAASVITFLGAERIIQAITGLPHLF